MSSRFRHRTGSLYGTVGWRFALGQAWILTGAGDGIDEEVRERSEPAERRGSGREASRGGKAPVEDDELLVNPYSGSPSAEATASAPNAAPTKAPAATKATSSKASRDCKKPYYLDADGIRRVKPECL